MHYSRSLSSKCPFAAGTICKLDSMGFEVGSLLTVIIVIMIQIVG